MSLIEKAGLAILHQLNPETAHGLSLRALKAGLVPTRGAITGPRLKTKLAGLQLPNPIGLAAGYDKNAEALPALMNAGFGFIEVGAATPRAQAGNDKPRLFRLPEDAAVINRFGFNNDGMVAIGTRLARRPAGIPVGLNLGANKDSADRAADFAQVLSACGPDCDFATVNVSSPNTEALRDLQGKAALAALLELVMDTNAGLPKPIPVFLKIAPDLSRREVDDIAEVALAAQVAGLVATNTTLARDGLINARRSEKGGLSGQPLFESSTRVLAQLHAATDGALPLIGVGGVASGAQAYQKIRAGATAVQLYTGLVYGGLSLLDRIASELDACLHRAGFASVSAAVGTGVDEWLTD